MKLNKYLFCGFLVVVVVVVVVVVTFAAA